MLKDGDGGDVQLAADQAEAQAPALRAAVGALDPGSDDAQVAQGDNVFGRHMVQQVRTVRSDSPV